MCSAHNDATYLYDIYYSYRKLNNTFLIKDPEVIKTILHHFKYYKRLWTAFHHLVDETRSQTADTSYYTAVLGLYYSLPEFSYCLGKKGEKLENIEIPLTELTSDNSPCEVLTSNMARKFKGNLVSSGDSNVVLQKIDAYFKELANEIEKADSETLSSIIRDMKFSSIPTCLENRGESGIRWAVFDFAKRSCVIMRLFDQNKDSRINCNLYRRSELLQKCIPGSRPDISYMNWHETVQPVDCKIPSIAFFLSPPTVESADTDDEVKYKESIQKKAEEMRNWLAVQALACHSNMSFISDGMDFYVLMFSFDSDSDCMDIPFTCSSCNLGFNGGPTPAQLIHSMMYDRWSSFIREKKRDGLKTLSHDFGKYRSKYFNFDSIEIYGYPSDKEIPESVKSKYKFNFTIIQDSEGWYLNLVFKLGLESCIQGFNLNVDRGLLKDNDEEVIVKLLDAEFMKDFFHEEALYPYEEYEEKFLKNFEKEIDVYRIIQRHNEENPSKLIHIPKLLGSGNIDTFVDTDTYNMRLLKGPVMVLECLKGMRHPETMDEFEKAEVEIERLAGLGYRHEDIKADNILYDPVEEIAYLLDFQYMSFDKNLDPAAAVNDFRSEYLSLLDEE